MKFADANVCQQYQPLKHLSSGFVSDRETLGRDLVLYFLLSVKQKPAADVSAVLKEETGGEKDRHLQYPHF